MIVIVIITIVLVTGLVLLNPFGKKTDTPTSTTTSKKVSKPTTTTVTTTVTSYFTEYPEKDYFSDDASKKAKIDSGLDKKEDAFKKCNTSDQCVGFKKGKDNKFYLFSKKASKPVEKDDVISYIKK